MTWTDGSRKYEGQFNKVNGEREGLGLETWTNGNFYEGEFKNDERSG